MGKQLAPLQLAVGISGGVEIAATIAGLLPAINDSQPPEDSYFATMSIASARCFKQGLHLRGMHHSLRVLQILRKDSLQICQRKGLQTETSPSRYAPFPPSTPADEGLVDLRPARLSSARLRTKSSASAAHMLEVRERISANVMFGQSVGRIRSLAVRSPQNFGQSLALNDHESSN